jgi:hypothetical protein
MVRFVGHPQSVLGLRNGAFLINISGTGRFDGVDGYEFDVFIQDTENEALPDTYRPRL